MRAVVGEDPDAAAVRRPPVQVERQVIHLLRLAAGETGDPAGPRDGPQVVDPQIVSGLIGGGGSLLLRLTLTAAARLSPIHLC